MPPSGPEATSPAASTGDTGRIMRDGHAISRQVRPGLTLALAAGRCQDTVTLTETVTPMLALYVNLRDPRTMGGAGRPVIEVPCGGLACIGLTEMALMAETLHPGQQLASAGVIVTEDLFRQLPDADADRMRALAQRISQGAGLGWIPATPGLETLGRQLLAGPDDGFLAGMRREALALSFLVEAAGALALPDNPMQPAPRHCHARLDAVAEQLSTLGGPVPDIALLARQAGMSVSVLRRRFKERFDQTLTDYARSRRLAAARRMLAQGDLSIAEIAWRCGYSDSANFSHAFRREFGVTPGSIAHHH